VAGFAGIAAAAKSVERLLNGCFRDQEPIANKKTRAVLARTADFVEGVAAVNIGSPALSIFLYRVDLNKTMRAAWSAVSSLDGRAHLAVDLHFLLSPWAENAEHEYRILGKAMQCLESTPVLSGPLLHPSTEWAPNESVQLVVEDIPPDSVMRLFDSLPTDFRLSVPYVARIVRIDARRAAPAVPVTTLITGTEAAVSP
jgi:hypothetical protein